jgi:hypothetical protein
MALLRRELAAAPLEGPDAPVELLRNVRMKEKSSKPVEGSMRAICPTVTAMIAPTLSK